MTPIVVELPSDKGWVCACIVRGSLSLQAVGLQFPDRLCWVTARVYHKPVSMSSSLLGDIVAIGSPFVHIRKEGNML